MDFSALIADLRTIASRYNGKDTDRNVSTAMYCEMFRKILQKAENGVTEYGDQIVILWMTLSQLCNTYQTLTGCPARDSLYEHIFLLCAKVVLNIKWQQLPDDDQGKVNFSQTIANTHQQLVNAGFSRFELLTQLMENPWTDPTLSKIMSGDDKDESSGSDTETEETEREKERKLKEKMDEIANYIKKEDPLILKLRVEMLILENCEDFASNLCNCIVKYESFKNDLDLREMQFVLLHKLNQMDKLQEECEQIICHFGIKIINRLEQKESNQKLCIRLVQIFLVQDWINPDRNCCTKELIKLWIRHQYMADKDRSKFLENVWSIAKLSSKTEQICVLVTGLQKECGAKLRQLYTDLCVYAINLDKGGCEQEMMQGNMDGVKEKQKSMAFTCEKLANIVAMTNLKAAKISALTAFALNPTKNNLHLVEKMYMSKTLNQASNKRKERIHKGKDMRVTHDGEVNLATLYEVERLLNMLRPYYLNPDLSWPELLPVCQKFMIEKGTSDSKEIKKESKEKMSTSVKDGLMQYYCDDTTQFIPNKQTLNVKTLTGISPPKSPWTSIQTTQSKQPVKESTKLIPYAKLQNISIQGSQVEMSKSGQPKRPRGRPKSQDFLRLLETTKNNPQVQVPSKTPSTQVSSKPSSTKTLSSNFHLPYVPGLTTEEVQRAMIQHKKNISRSISLEQLSSQKHSRSLSLEHTPSGSSNLSNWNSASVTDLSKTSHRPRIIPERTQNQEKSSNLMSFQESFPGKVNHSALHNIIQSNQIEVTNEVTGNPSVPAITTALPARRSRQPSKEELQSIVDWLQTGTEDAKIKPSPTIFLEQSGEKSIGLIPKQKKPIPVTNSSQENSNQYFAFGTSPNQAFQNAQINQQQLKIQPGVSKNFASQVMSKVGIKPGMSEEEINVAQIKALLKQKQDEKQRQAQQKQLQMAAASKGFLLIPGSAHMVMQAKMQGQRTKMLTSKQKLKEAQKTLPVTSTATVVTSTGLQPHTNFQNVSSHEGHDYVNQMIQSTKHNAGSSKSHSDLSTQPTLNLGAQPIVSSLTSSLTNKQKSRVPNKYREVDIQHALQSLSKVLDKSATVLNQSQFLQGKAKKDGDKIERPIRPASAMPNMMSSTTIVVTSQTNSAIVQSAKGIPTSTLVQNQPSATSPGQNSAYQLLYLGQIKTGKSAEVSSVQQMNSATTVEIPSNHNNQSINISSQGVGLPTIDLPPQNFNNQNVGIPNVLSTNLLVQGNASQIVSSMQPVQEMTVPSVYTLDTPDVTMQGINAAALEVQTVSSQNVAPLGVPALEVQTLSGQSVTVKGIGSTTLGVQTLSSPNLTVPGINSQIIQVQALTSQNTISQGLSAQGMAVGAMGVSAQGFFTQPTLNLQNQASCVSAPVFNVQGLSSQNTILPGIGIQPMGAQPLSVQNQSIMQCHPLQEIGFQTPVDNISLNQNIQGQTVFGLTNLTPVSETIGFSNLPQDGVAMNIKRVVPNTTVTFTTSTGLMSSQVSTPTNILPISENNCSSVGNTVLPLDNITQTVALSLGNIVSSGITPGGTVLSTTQTELVPRAGNLMSTQLSDLVTSVSTPITQQENLILDGTTVIPINSAADPQKSQPYLRGGTTNSEGILAVSKTATQPISIRPKPSAGNVQIGPFQFVSDSAETTTNSGYLIPFSNSENTSSITSSNMNTAATSGFVVNTNLLDTQPLQLKPDIVEMSPMLHAMLKKKEETPEVTLEKNPKKDMKNGLEVVRRVSSGEMNKHFGKNEQENNSDFTHVTENIPESTASHNNTKQSNTKPVDENLKILDSGLHPINDDKIESLLTAIPPISNPSSLNIVDIHITTCNQSQSLQKDEESSVINTGSLDKAGENYSENFTKNTHIDQVSDQQASDGYNLSNSNLLGPSKLIRDPIQENFWKDFTRFKERLAGCKLHSITKCSESEITEKSVKNENSNFECRDIQTECNHLGEVKEITSESNSDAKVSENVTYGHLVDKEISEILHSPYKNSNLANNLGNVSVSDTENIRISQLGESGPKKMDKNVSDNIEIMKIQETDSEVVSDTFDCANDVATEHKSEMDNELSSNNKQDIFENTHKCLFESLKESPKISQGSVLDFDKDENSDRSSIHDPSNQIPEASFKSSEIELQNSESYDTENGIQNNEIKKGDFENEKLNINDKLDSLTVDALEQDLNDTNNSKSMLKSDTEQCNVDLSVSDITSSNTAESVVTKDEKTNEISSERSISENDESVDQTEAGPVRDNTLGSTITNETEDGDLKNLLEAEHNESYSEIAAQNLHHHEVSNSYERIVDYSETSESENETVSLIGNISENSEEINGVQVDNTDKTECLRSEFSKEDTDLNNTEIQLLPEQELVHKNLSNSDGKMNAEDLLEDIPDKNHNEKEVAGVLQHEVNEKEIEISVDEKESISTPQQLEEKTISLVTVNLEDNKHQQSVQSVKPEIGDALPQEKGPDPICIEQVFVKSSQQVVPSNEGSELSESFQTNTQEKVQKVSDSITHHRFAEELERSPSEGQDRNDDSVSLISDDDEIKAQQTIENDDSGKEDIVVECEKHDKVSTPIKNDLMENYKKLMDEMLNLSATKQNEFKSNRNDDKFSASKSFGFDDLLDQNDIYTPSPHLARSLPDDWAPGNPKKLARSISYEERTLKRSFSDVDLSSTDESDFDTRSVISDRDYQQKSLYSTSQCIQKHPLYKIQYPRKNNKYKIMLPQLNKEKKPKIESYLLSYGEWKNKESSSEIITSQLVPEVKPVLLQTCKALDNEMKVNSEEEENKCKICLRTFDTMDGLRRHIKRPCRQDIRKTVMEIKNLHYETIFTCNGCKTSTRTEFAAKLHCEVCRTGIRSKLDYTKDTFFRCRMCGEAFRYQKTACQHVTKYCKMLPQERIPKNSSLQISNQSVLSSGCQKVSLEMGKKLSEKASSEDIDKTNSKDNIKDSFAESHNQETECKSTNVTDSGDNKATQGKETMLAPSVLGYKDFVKEEVEENMNEKEKLIKSGTENSYTLNKAKLEKVEIEKDADNESVKSFSTESSYVTIDASETSSIKSGEYKAPKTVQPKHSARLISKQIGKRMIKAKKFFGDQFEVHDYVEKQAKKMNLKRKFKTGYKSGLNISPKLRRALKKKKICKEKNYIKSKSQWQKKTKKDLENSPINKDKMEKIKQISNHSGKNFTKDDSEALFSFIEYEKHERKVLRCQWRGCNGPFSNTKSLMIHLDKCHQLRTYSKISDRFKCKFCSFDIDCYDKSMKHSVSHFSNLVAESIDGHSSTLIEYLSSLIEKKDITDNNSRKLGGEKLETDKKSIENSSDKTEGQGLSAKTRNSGKVKEKESIKGVNLGGINEITIKKDQVFTMRTRKTVKEEQTKQNRVSQDKNNRIDVCVEKMKKETKEGSIRTRKSSIVEEKMDFDDEKVKKDPNKLEVDLETKEENKKLLISPNKEKITKNDMVFPEMKQNDLTEPNCDKIVNRRCSRRSIPNNKESITRNQELLNNVDCKTESECEEKMTVTKQQGNELVPDSMAVRRSARKKTDGLLVYKDFCLSDQKLSKAEVKNNNLNEIHDQSNQLSSLKMEVSHESSDLFSGKYISTRSGKKHNFGPENNKTPKIGKIEKKDEVDGSKSEDNVELDIPCTRNTRKRHFSFESNSSKSSVESQKKMRSLSNVDKNDIEKKSNVTRKNPDDTAMDSEKSSEMKSRNRRSSLSDMKLIEGNRNLVSLRSRRKERCHSNKDKIVKSEKRIRNHSRNKKSENNKIEKRNQDSNGAFIDSFKKFVGISKKSSTTNQIKNLKQGKSNKLKSQAILHRRRQNLRKSKEQVKQDSIKSAIDVVKKDDVEIVDLIEIKDFRKSNKNNSKETSGKVEVIDLTNDCQMSVKDEQKSGISSTSNNKKLSFLDSFLAHVNEKEGKIPSDKSTADRTRKVSGERRDSIVGEKKESVRHSNVKNVKEKLDSKVSDDNKKDHLKCSSDSKVNFERPSLRSKDKLKVIEEEKVDKKRPKEEDKNKSEAGQSTKGSSQIKEKSNAKNQAGEGKIQKQDAKKKKGKIGDVLQEGKESVKKNCKQKSSVDDIEIIVTETLDEDSAQKQNTSNRTRQELVKSPVGDSSFQSSFMSYIDFSDTTNVSTSSSNTLKSDKRKPRKKSPFKWDLDDDDTGSSKTAANKSNENTSECNIHSAKTPVLVSEIKLNSNSDVVSCKLCDQQSKRGLTKTVYGHCTEPGSTKTKTSQSSTVGNEKTKLYKQSSSTEGSLTKSDYFSPPCSHTRSRTHSASSSDARAVTSKQSNDAPDKSRSVEVKSGEVPGKFVKEKNDSTSSLNGENNILHHSAEGVAKQGSSQKSNCDFEKHFVKFISGSSDIDMNTDCISKNESHNIEVGQKSINFKNLDTERESKKKVTMETKSVASNLDPFPLKSKVPSLSSSVKHRTKLNFAASHNKRYNSKSFLVRKTTTNTKLIPISELNVVNRKEFTKGGDVPKTSAMDQTSTENLGNNSLSGKSSDSKLSTSTSQHKLVALDSHRVRHMYHGGKVWQIGQGSVSATNLASPTKRQQSNINRDSDKKNDHNSSAMKHCDSSKDEHQSEKSSEKKIEKQSRWKARRSPQKRTAVSDSLQNTKKSRNT